MKKHEREKIKRTNKGITLIALVITIIVLLILAGISISMLSGDNSILNQAANAEEKTSVAQIEENIKLAVTGALADGLGTLTDENLKAELTSYLGAEGTEYTITGDETSGWTVTVDDNSYEISSTGSVTEKVIGKWYIDENGYITDGDTKLEIADTVDYDPGTSADSYTSYSTTNGSSTAEQTYKVTDYSGDWLVFGVEDGQILLISSQSIGSFSLYGQLGYQNGISELNKICAIYGNGTYADYARTVTAEDINELVGYDPTTYEGYGEEWTYTMNSDGKVEYSYSGGSGTSTYTVFNYYDSSSKSWKSLEKEKSVTLTNTWYTYSPYSSSSAYTLSGSYYQFSSDATKTDKVIGINGATNSGCIYWLGSSYVYSRDGVADFGLHFMYGSYMYDYVCAISYGYGRGYSYAVRAVVSLQSDITLTENGDNSWTLSE